MKWGRRAWERGWISALAVMGLGAVAVSAATVPAAATPLPSATANTPIAEISVQFPVVNENRSAVKCLTDGKRYTLSGHIVGPAAAMHSGGAATLYLHGAVVPEDTWRMPVSGYDYGFEQAKLGHISVTVDRLGYGASSIPNGFLTCTGGQADMAHQVISELRSGGYQASAPISFGRVALSGHSAGMEIAQVEAYSFHDIDALLAGGWADPIITPTDVVAVLPTIRTCASGGQRKRPGAAGGYAFTFQGQERRLLFYNAEESVVDAYVARHERDPCDASMQISSPISFVLLSRVRVPVLLFYGLNDGVWSPGTGKRQRALFTGSRDVTLLELPDTGHMIMLGRTAPAFRSSVANWLGAHGL